MTTNRTLTWALTFSALASITGACATATTIEDDGGVVGSGGATGGRNAVSGGASSGGASSGGAASGGAASGGAGTGGASGGSSGSCEPGEETPCSAVSSNPNQQGGTAVCTASGLGWSVVGCTVCDAGDTEDCALHDADRPEGDAVCNAGGSGWEVDGCVTCVTNATKPCAELPIAATNPFGNAVCMAGAYDTSTCKVCEANVGTIDCADLGAPFTGGTATCNGTGNAYSTTTCEQCGDGVQDSNEECDDTDPGDTTCAALGFDGDDTVVGCTSTCSWNRNACSKCPGPDCLSGGSCSGAGCSNKECNGQAASTCTFQCDYQNATCDGMTCGSGATCNLACKKGSNTTAGCTNVLCKPGSKCNLDCDNGGGCSDVTCTGATCSFKCNNSGQTCSTTGQFTCKSGEKCVFQCQNGANCQGIQVKCESGSNCQATCDNGGSLCPAMVCEAGSTCGRSCANNAAACAPITCPPGGCTGYTG